MKRLLSIFFILNLFFINLTIKGIEITTIENTYVEGTSNEESIETDTLNLIPNSQAGILIERETGKILFEKDMNHRLAPASMTKIMTLLLVYEALDNNILNKDSVLTVDEYSASIGGSQVYLKVGEKITVDEALKCVCIASANDCATLLGVNISGSIEGFINKMNEKVELLGLKNTHFSDCTGLSNKDHYSSAYDMAIIAKELVTKYPDIFNYTSIKEDYIRKDTDSPFWLVNTNKLIGRVEGIDGLKTGYCSFSGYNITLHMSQNGMSLISVVFGYKDSKTRNSESLELLRYGFSNYELKVLLKKDTLLEEIKSPQYKYPIRILVKNDIYVLIKKNEEIDYTYDYEYNLDDYLEGKAYVYVNNKTLEGEIYTDSIIEKRNLFEIMGYLIMNSI